MISNVIRVYHDDMAHCGPEKTFRGISATYWFPAMRKKIIDYIENCIVCILANTSSHAREGEMQLMPSASKPFEVLHMDHFGPLQVTDEGYRFTLVIVEAFTRFTWLVPTKSTGIKEVLAHLEFLFNIFGTPAEIVTAAQLSHPKISRTSSNRIG